MRRAGLSICLALALALPNGVNSQSSTLKRLTLRQDLLGFEAVGKLELGRAGYCTGVLIETHLVLTAAHCVAPVAEGRIVIGDLRFRAGLRDGQVVAERRAVRAVMLPGYRVGHWPDAVNVHNDVALVELADAIPAATAAPFRVDRLSGQNQAVSVVSYAAGRDSALSWQGQCNVLGRQGPLFAFDCDVTFGASGAPVFDRSGSRPRVVSLISSGSRRSEGTIAFGMELPAAIATLKRQLRTGRGLVGQADAGGSGPDAKFLRP